jgi:ATP-dependent Clp protease ATP-binding subunit ClpC
MFETFTETAKQSIFFARFEASKSGSSAIEPEHLALGLLRADFQLGSRLFATNDDLLKARDRLQQGIPMEKSVPVSVDMPLSRSSQRVISYAAAEAERLGQANTGTVHLLLGIMRENTSKAASVLRELGVTIEQLDEAAQGKTAQPAAPVVIDGLRNLVHEASQGRLPALIGRERELEQMIQILSRRTRSCPVLVGEPGVGKESLVFGLAQRIADGLVPDHLLNVQILAVDARDLAREFSPNRPPVPAHVRSALQAGPAVILYVRGLFDLREAVPLLAMHFKERKAGWIVTSSPLSYRLALERADELAHCFEAVSVLPPAPDETVAIADSAKGGFEGFHGVVISPEAIQAAVLASGRLLRHRSLPDSVLDLMDDASARVRLRQEALPPELFALKRRGYGIAQERERAIRQHNFEEAQRLSELESSVRAEFIQMKEALPARAQEKIVTAEDIFEAAAVRLSVTVDAVKTAVAREDHPDLISDLHAKIPPGRRDWVAGLYAHLATCSHADAEHLASAIQTVKKRLSDATTD